MSERTDPHRPGALVPGDYEYVAPEHLRIMGPDDVQALLEARERIKAHMAQTGGTYSRHEHGGNCGVCGNVNAIWTVLFYHRPTNTYVRMGQECAMQVDSAAWEGMDRLQRAVKDAEARRAGKAKAQATLAELGLEAAWAVRESVGERARAAQVRWENATDAEQNDPYAPQFEPGISRDEYTVADMVLKLIRYGSLSEKQVAFLRTLLARIEQRPAIEAARKAEREAAQPVPKGRVEFDAEVLKVRHEDYGYNRTAIKVLLKSADGWLAWGTLPSGAYGAERGAKLRLRATLQPSDTDPKFGYFQRPVLTGEVVQPVEADTTLHQEGAL